MMAFSNIIFCAVFAAFTYAQPKPVTPSMTDSLNQPVTGWDFLEWGMQKATVEAALAENDIELIDTHGDDSWALVTRFEQDGFRIWLHYSEEDQLEKIEQIREFSILEDDAAQACYEKVLADCVEKWGKAPEYEIDAERELRIHDWQSKTTKIGLTYDHKYKIIDEFGAASYSVRLHFLPVSPPGQ